MSVQTVSFFETMGTGKCIFLLCTSCVVLQEKSEKERKQQENETESTNQNNY